MSVLLEHSAAATAALQPGGGTPRYGRAPRRWQPLGQQKTTLQRISIVSNHIPLSSPVLSRRPRALEHRARIIEVAGTSPATTRERWQVVQYDREPLLVKSAAVLMKGRV